ncbi:MAG: hypothetical protein RLO81_09975 [Fulvivirga sp.]|uniref:hypothetical protein n=1 Tax=Fulvivirga sp. TaxID=1931237 RepID=UPI0032EF72C7
MTESEVNEIIKDIPVGAKLQLIKTDGSIIEVVLASHETTSIAEQNYGGLRVPEQPPALLVQGGRWGVYRLEIEQIVNIAVLETK